MGNYTPKVLEDYKNHKSFQVLNFLFDQALCIHANPRNSATCWEKILEFKSPLVSYKRNKPRGEIANSPFSIERGVTVDKDNTF
jgi:hypothetical protein